MTRVLVLADSSVVRAGLHAMLRESGRFEPTAGDLPVNWHYYSRVEVDVILAEITSKRLASLSPAPESADAIPLVLLVDEVTRSELLRAVHNGARAILPRTAQSAEIVAAIDAVAAGLAAFGPDELDLSLPTASDPEPEVVLEALSGREIEVLALMTQGLPNKIIADRLHLSEHTVKFHVSSILSKLAASSRTDAVTRGLKAGLLVI